MWGGRQKPLQVLLRLPSQWAQLVLLAPPAQRARLAIPALLALQALTAPRALTAPCPAQPALPARRVPPVLLARLARLVPLDQRVMPEPRVLLARSAPLARLA